MTTFRTEKAFLIALVIAFCLWVSVEPDLFGVEVSWLEKPSIWRFGITIIALLVLGLSVHPDKLIFSVSRITRRSTLFCLTMLGVLICLLVPLGLALGFFELQSPSLPSAGRVFMIFFFNALPEEILFRAFIQDFLTNRANASFGLFATSILFGWSHINNPTTFHDTPNWTYVLLATLAGVVYGVAYHRSRSVWLTTILHFLVNTFWFVFFTKMIRNPL